MMYGYGQGLIGQINEIVWLIAGVLLVVWLWRQVKK